MLFGKKSKEEEYVKCCALCEHASQDGGEYMICRKKGQVEKTSVCRKFTYDITKRIPKKRPEKFSFEE